MTTRRRRSRFARGAFYSPEANRRWNLRAAAAHSRRLSGDGMDMNALVATAMRAGQPLEAAPTNGGR